LEPRKIIISDELIEKWKHMPMMLYFDLHKDEYIATKQMHVDGGTEKLSQSATVRRSTITQMEKRHGDSASALRACRKHLDTILNNRIDERYGGRNLVLQEMPPPETPFFQ